MQSYASIVFASVVVTSALQPMSQADEPSSLSAAASTAVTRSESPSAKTEPPSSRRAARLRTGDTPYNWAWLAARYDKDGDGAIRQEDLPVPKEVFDRLDRSWDGTLSDDDFDWSPTGALCQQKETAFALFKAIDTNSNGRIRPEELQAMFADAAGEKGYLDDEDLEQLMYLPRVLKTRAEEQFLAGREGQRFDLSQRAAEAPKPGSLAPDFELGSPDGRATVKLSSLRGGKPVVLIFGCYTCGNYRTYSDPLEAMYRRWKDRAEFLRVYVREAHPVSKEQQATSTNSKAGILITQAASLEERCSVAGQFCDALRIGMPVVVDGIDNRVGDAYASWPDRLYIVDAQGRVAYQGAPGPFGFNPREMEQILLLMLLDQQKVVKK